MLAGYLVVTSLVMIEAGWAALPLLIGLMILGRFVLYLHADPVAVAYVHRKTLIRKR